MNCDDPYDSDSNIDFIIMEQIKSSDEDEQKIISKRKKKKKIQSLNYTETISCLCVIDLDDTLIDKNNKLIDGAKKFLIKLNTFNEKGYNILWSLGNNTHVSHQWDTRFKQFFDNVIVGHAPAMKNCGKPITYAKKFCSNREAFTGPSIIIDNDPTNIRLDQYDIAINVSKYFNNKTGMPLSINYDNVYHNIITKVNDWYRLYVNN